MVWDFVEGSIDTTNTKIIFIPSKLELTEDTIYYSQGIYKRNIPLKQVNTIDVNPYSYNITTTKRKYLKWVKYVVLILGLISLGISLYFLLFRGDIEENILSLLSGNFKENNTYLKLINLAISIIILIISHFLKPKVVVTNYLSKSIRISTTGMQIIEINLNYSSKDVADEIQSEITKAIEKKSK